MAGGGKSQKGRGGKSGGMGSSSGRNSSQSSNPSTHSPLPSQYAHSQSSVPVTQSSRGSALQPPPRGSAQQPPPPFRPQPLRPQTHHNPPPPYAPPPYAPPPYAPPPYAQPPYAQPPYAQPPLGPETDAQPKENHPLPVDPQPPQQDPPISLDDLLRTPGRDAYLPILDPLDTPNTTWFDRDDGKLVRKISKILKSKFDGPYYCWTKTPTHVKDRCFIAFAQSHHWDPIITPLVEEQFKSISLLRMKDMVSKAKKKKVRPTWIGETLWERMCCLWATEEAIQRSIAASNAINFPLDGLGKRIHRSGQKSYLRIQRDMEKELGRPVSIGEVFIRTHTRPDGSFVDPKSQNIVEAYEKNLEDTMSQIMADPTDCSSELTTAAKDDVFLKMREAMNTVLVVSGNTMATERGREGQGPQLFLHFRECKSSCKLLNAKLKNRQRLLLHGMLNQLSNVTALATWRWS